MLEKEGVPQEFRDCKPEAFEIMAGLVCAIGGSFPIDEGNFAKGLKAAVVKAPFLVVFIDEETCKLTQVAQSALGTLETMDFIARIDGDWKVPDSDNLKIQLDNRVTGVFNQRGRAVLKEAAEAAREVWAK